MGPGVERVEGTSPARRSRSSQHRPRSGQGDEFPGRDDLERRHAAGPVQGRATFTRPRDDGTTRFTCTRARAPDLAPCPTWALVPAVRQRPQAARRALTALRDTRRAPVVGGPSSGSLAIRSSVGGAWPLERLTRRTRAPPPTRAIPASSIGPELAPVKGSWPRPRWCWWPRPPRPGWWSCLQGGGATLVSGGRWSGALGGGGRWSLRRPAVVVVSSSHLSAGGRSSLPVSWTSRRPSSGRPR